MNFCDGMMFNIWWISHLFSVNCLSFCKKAKFVWPSLFGQFCLYLPFYDKTKPLCISVMIWCLKFDGFPIYSRSIVCLFVRRPSLFRQFCFIYPFMIKPNHCVFLWWYDAWYLMDFPSILGQLFVFLWEGQVCFPGLVAAGNVYIC